MDTLLKCSSCMPSVTYIFNTFIDNYMIAANGSYVKVYLFLCKCIQSGDTNISVSALADMMDNTENDIIRALKYWEKNNLIYISRNSQNGQMTGVELLNPGTASKNAAKNLNNLPLSQNSTYEHNTSNISKSDAYTQNNATAKSNTDIPKNDNYTNNDLNTLKNSTSENNNLNTPKKPVVNKNNSNQTNNTTSIEETENSNNIVAATDAPADSSVSDNNQTEKKNGAYIEINITKEQAQQLANNTEFNWICRVIEKYLNRPLSSKEIQLISYLYDNLNFSVDLLLHLYEYCISLGKTNVNYIQAVAISWDEQNVKTPEEAKSVSVSYNSAHTSISKAFALGRPLAVIEKQFTHKWMNEWNMDLSVILDACSRTMLKLQKADFKYADGILDNWHKKDVHTLQDVKKADELYAKNKAEQKKNKTAQKATAKPQNKNQFNNFQQRGTSQSDVDELEQKLLKRG